MVGSEWGGYGGSYEEIHIHRARVLERQMEIKITCKGPIYRNMRGDPPEKAERMLKRPIRLKNSGRKRGKSMKAILD